MLLKLLFLAGFVLAGSFAIYYYQMRPPVDAEKQALLDKNQQLQQIVTRLNDERRVAQLLVTDQKVVDGQTRTTLLFVEYARNDEPLPPREFTIMGAEAHLDALVVKFDHYLVENNDALRNHSLALFTRIYGDHQAPIQGSAVDTPGKIPEIYRGTGPQVQKFETDLWQDFWQLAENPDLAKSKGVRVANGDGLFWPCRPGEVYTVSVESNGGMNLATEPLKGIYADALQRKP
jgi:hypothetical protein